MRRAFVLSLLLAGCSATYPIAPTRVADRARPVTSPVAGQVPPDPHPTPVAPVLAHGPIQTATLPNGMRVVALERHDLPIVALTVGVAHGTMDAQPYVADVLFRDLGHGPEKKEHSLHSFLWWLGVRSTTRVSRESAYMQWLTLSSHTGSVIHTIGQLLREPSFGGDEVEHARDDATDALRMAQAEPNYLASHTVNALVGLDMPDDPAGPARVGRAEVEAAYHALVTPNAITLVAVGDFDTGWLVKKATTELGPLGGHGAASPRPEPTRSATRLVIVDRAKGRDASIAVSLKAAPRDGADAGAFRLACAVLRDRANTRTRIRSGYTYGVQVGCSSALRTLDVTMSTATSRAPEALKELLGAIASVEARPPNADELADARASLATGLVVQLESNDSASWALAVAAANGLRPDIGDVLDAAARKATADDVVAAARTYFSDPRVAIVGDAPALAADLSALGLGSAEVR